MARHVIVLALVFFAVVGLASAAGRETAAAGAPVNPPKPSLEGHTVGAPVSPDTIGTTDEGVDGEAGAPSGDDDDVAVAGPLGSDATYAGYPPAEPPKGSAAALGVSAVAGVAAVAGSLFFF